MRSGHRNRTGLSANRAKSSTRVWAAAGGLGGLAVLCGPALAQTPSFEIIPPQAGFDFFKPSDISDQGIVVGSSYLNIGNPIGALAGRYVPGVGGTQYTFYPSNVSPGLLISGDGSAVAGRRLSSGAGDPGGPTVWYPDGSFHIIPRPIVQGLTTNVVFQSLNHDGTSAALTYHPFPNNPTAQGSAVYRWTLQDNIAQLPPSPLLGTTYSFVNGMSDDGRYIVGRMAPNTNFPDAPFAWDTQQNTLVPLLDENGQVMTTGVATTISGDGHTIFANARIIVDGVSTFWTDGQPFTGVFPSDASYDASVLVGLLGTPDGLGAWVWTESTGAVRANDYFRSFGLNFPATARIRDLMVSGDGRHFAGWIESGSAGFVVTIPAPGAAVSLTLGGILATTRRRRR
ncbi:MAG: hypothetical protein IPK69_03240 [Phycisphaerales bacterium]|nr:MAG: hypothetical protein IPK69_03240 [Phycisphaerales bacterium]